MFLSFYWHLRDESNKAHKIRNGPNHFLLPYLLFAGSQKPFSFIHFVVFILLRKIRRRRNKKINVIHLSHLRSSPCFMVVDDAKWKRKSCQHASKMLDLWLISFGSSFYLACLFFMLFFHFSQFFSPSLSYNSQHIQCAVRSN